MSWAERFAERFARTLTMRWRARAFMFGGLLTAIGGWTMYSDTTHQLNGQPSTATLIDHIKECTVEYQRVGEDRRKNAMACDAAEAFQQRIGSGKIRVAHQFFALVRLSLADGREHEAKVDESKLGSYNLPIGAKIAVVYAPDHPNDVRALLSWERLKTSLTLFAGGLVFLMLAFAGRIVALYSGAFPGRTLDAGNAGLISPSATRMVSERYGAGLRMTGSAPRSTFGTRR